MVTINLDSTTLPTQLPTYEGKCCRGEHGQDQDWMSCKIHARFSDQDWIWIFIFEKKLIRTGYLFDFYNEISLGVNQEVKNGGRVFFLCDGFYIHKKIKIISSGNAAIITVNDDSCYFIVTFFSWSGSSNMFMSCWYVMLLCLLCWAACVLCRLVVYFMGGQLNLSLTGID